MSYYAKLENGSNISSYTKYYCNALCRRWPVVALTCRQTTLRSTQNRSTIQLTRHLWLCKLIVHALRCINCIHTQTFFVGSDMLLLLGNPNQNTFNCTFCSPLRISDDFSSKTIIRTHMTAHSVFNCNQRLLLVNHNQNLCNCIYCSLLRVINDFSSGAVIKTHVTVHYVLCCE